MNSSRHRRARAPRLPAVLLCVAFGVVPLAPATARRLPAARAEPPAVPLTTAMRLEALRSHEDFVDAFALAVQLLQASQRAGGPLSPQALTDLHRIGRIAFDSGDLDIASDVLELAYAWRQKALPALDPGLAESLCDVGLAARLTLPRETAGDYAAACLKRALEIVRAQPTPDPRLLGRILQGQANVVRGRSLDASVPLYERALARRDSQAVPSYDRADNLTWLGWVEYQAGDHDKALRTLARAESDLLALGIDDASILGSVLERRTDALLLGRQWPQAEVAAQRTATAFEKARDEYLPGFARGAVPLNGYDLLALAQIEQGKFAAAWESTERFRGNAALDFTTVCRARERDPESYAALRAARADWSAAHEFLDWAALRQHGPPDTANWDRLLRLLDAQARIFVAERDLLRRHRPAPVTLQQLQQQLPPRTAFVSFLRAGLGGSRRQTRGPFRDVVYLCVVRPDRAVQWVRVWDVDSPAALTRVSSAWRAVDAMRARAAQWRFRIENDPAYLDSLRSLGATLFDPIEAALSGIDAIVAEYPLSGIPLEQLRDASGRFLLDRFAFTYVPSATVYRLLADHSANPARDRGRALIVGDPVLSPGLARGLRGWLEPTPAGIPVRAPGIDSLAVLPRLAHSADEIRGVAAAWTSRTILSRKDASETALARRAASGELARDRALHFATHFLTDARPQRVGIALAPDGPGAGHDGVVTAREIQYGWELDADLVTLGGCLAARGARLTDGSEFVGLTQALYGAGARAVVASLWEVDDEATALLMRRFYQNWTGRGSKHPRLGAAAALAEARRWLRDLERDGQHPFAHPVYWAGFVLTGACD